MPWMREPDIASRDSFDDLEIPPFYSIDETPSVFWDILSPILVGLSAIDSQKLHLSSIREAELFIESYGFSYNYQPHLKELERIRQEALSFIEEELLSDEPKLQIPPQIRDETDIRKLLLLASESEDDLLQNWACALLRVMHTFIHSRSYLNELFGEEIKEQILERFSKHIHRTKEGGLFLGRGSEAIPLLHFEFKHSKPLRSVVMKLLHKPENVAADIFDRIGLRFITRDKLDALLVIRYLRKNHVIMFANIKPSRSRNTLIDIQRLQTELLIIDSLLKKGKIEGKNWLEKLRTMLQSHPYPHVPPNILENPFRSIHYHSIQFTCRQMIRIPLKKFSAHRENGTLQSLFAEFARAKYRGVEEISFFFPFEVQIMDIESYRRSRSGLASHDEYKRRQRESVKERVLKKLLW